MGRIPQEQEAGLPPALGQSHLHAEPGGALEPGARLAQPVGQIRGALAREAGDPLLGGPLGGGFGGIQNPTQLDAPSGALKQAEDPLMAHHGGEVALKGAWAWLVVWTCAGAIQVKPQHIDGA